MRGRSAYFFYEVFLVLQQSGRNVCAPRSPPFRPRACPHRQVFLLLQLHKCFDKLVSDLLLMLSKDVAENVKTCSQYFWLLHMYVQMVRVRSFLHSSLLATRRLNAGICFDLSKKQSAARKMSEAPQAARRCFLLFRRCLSCVVFETHDTFSSGHEGVFAHVRQGRVHESHHLPARRHRHKAQHQRRRRPQQQPGVFTDHCWPVTSFVRLLTCLPSR